MKVIQPVVINPDTMQAGHYQVQPDQDNLVVLPNGDNFMVYPLYVNVPEETGYATWDNGSTYPAETRVIHNHVIWYTQIGAGAGDEPGDEADPDNPIWINPLMTNPWRMFDHKVGTLTTNPDVIEFQITPGMPVDSIAFFEVDAASIQIVIFDAATGIIETRTAAPVLTDGITDWYQYFTKPIELLRDFVVTGLKQNTFYSLKVTISKPGGLASVGEVVLGRTFELGDSIQGSSVGIVDYSRKDRDAFGNWVIVPRTYSKRGEFDVLCDTDATGAILRFLSKFRATPAVFIGHPDLEATLIYGFYKEFDIILGGACKSEMSITVEGLTQ